MARTPDRSGPSGSSRPGTERAERGDGKTGSEPLARIVRERREELGLSRQELADAAGIPYPTIAQIETAYRGVSPARLGVIARVLGLDPKELFEVLASEEPAASDVRAPSAVEVGLDRPAPAVRRAGAARPASGETARSGQERWHANPRFAAAAPRSTPRAVPVAAPAPAPAATTTPDAPAAGSPRGPATSESEAVERAVALLAALPADRRIDALGRVQKRLLEQLLQQAAGEDQ